MPVLERILAMGITGGGKSYQWLRMAEALKPTGSIFRCLDTDNAISFMLETQFPQLLPEKGGNVYVHKAFTWPEYKMGVDWLQRKNLSKETIEYLSSLEPYVLLDHKQNMIKPIDWTVVDMADNAWKTVQSYFTSEVFGEDIGDYFLQIRREIQAGVRKTAKGGQPASVVKEGFEGWKDWSVMNKLYDDWILPIVYRINTHVYATTKVERIDRDEKDAELLTLFGDLGLRPAGQKALGHQMHSIFLFIPGKEEWFVTTVKDRSGRSYFKKTKITSFHIQYLVAKANWAIV